MEKFEIAGLTVEMDAKSGLLFDRSRAYLADGSKPSDMIITVGDNFFKSRQEKYPNLSLEECQYVWTGEAFYLNLLKFDGFMMHASCVCKDDKAYLFSARSGTGKSTHTHLWLKEFPGSYIINDDKPAIRLDGGSFYAYGTPFSGKNDESVNSGAKVRAIVFIERDKENRIEKIDAKTAIPLFMSQTIRPKTPQYMGILLTLLDSLLKSVPVFILHCNTDAEAAHISYDGIEGYYNSIEKGDKSE